jgi:hypothetical protein
VSAPARTTGALVHMDSLRMRLPCDRRAEGVRVSVALFTRQRKEAYEALHPETRAHIAGAHAANRAMGNASANLAPAFTADTAKKTGQSERAWTLPWTLPGHSLDAETPFHTPLHPSCTVASSRASKPHCYVAMPILPSER